MRKRLRLPILAIVITLVNATGLWSQQGAAGLDTPPRPSAVTAAANTALAKTRIDYFTPATRVAVPAAAAGGAAALIQETRDPLVITDSAPQGEVPWQMTAPTVYVVFSQPVVPLARLGAVATSSPVMKITPAVKGVYRWYGTRMLAFEPGESLKPLVSYTATVGPGTTSLGGKKLSGPASFEFHAEHLRLLSLGFASGVKGTREITPADARNIIVRFSAPVDPSFIRTWLEVHADGAPVTFAASRPAAPGPDISADDLSRMVLIRLDKMPPEAAHVAVTLKEGAMAAPGLFPISASQELAFETLTVFRFESSEKYAWGFPGGTGGDSNAVYLVFSHPPQKDRFASLITFDPPIDVKDSNLQFWKSTVKLNNLPFAFDTTYHVTLDPQLRDIYGRKLSSGTTYFNVEIGDPYRYAYIPNEGVGILESQFPKKLVWESQDLKEGRWGIEAITDPYHFAVTQSPIDFKKFPLHTKHFEVVDFTRLLNSSGKGWVGAQWTLQEYRHREERPQTHSVSLQVTDLGLTVRYGWNKVVCLVSHLSTGAVVPGATVVLNDTDKDIRSAVTDQSGMGVFSFEPGELVQGFFSSKQVTGSPERRHLRIRVESGDDKMIFEPNFSHNPWHHGVEVAYVESVEKPHPEVFLFSDRRIYRPGETVTFRGIDRTLRLGRYSPYQGGFTIRLRQGESQQADLTITGTSSASGGFTGTIKLPEELAAGDYLMEYARDGEAKKILQREPVTVSFFRRLLFATTLTSPERPFVLGDILTFALKAEYLSGGAVGGAGYEGYWTKEPGYFQPRGSRWDSYIFGPAGDWEVSDTRSTLSAVRGTLSGLGQAPIEQATTKEGILGQAYAYRLHVNVTDRASSQLVGASRGVLVHPADFYVAGKLSPGGRRYGLVEKNQPVSLDLALVRPDGTLYSPTAGQQVQAEVRRIEWKIAQQQGVGDEVNTRWERVEKVTLTAAIYCPDGTGKWTFTPDAVGMYSIMLKAADADGRTAATRLGLYVTGADWVRWYSEGAQDITLVPDKTIYGAGDTARLLMQSPIPAGTYLQTIEREGILDQKVIEVKGSTQVIEVPLKEDYLPIVYVALSSYTVRQGPPKHTYSTKDLDKPKGLFGVVALRVESKLKRIDLEIVPGRQIYRPGTDAEILIRARNKDAPLANAEITFMVVDRGVVDLVNYHVPDPVAFYYDAEKFPLAVHGADSRSLLVDPVTYEVKDLHGGDAEDTKIPERKDFRPTAFFQPSLMTDARGEVRVKFTLPDSLTTFRCTALGLKDDLLGISEQDLKVQNPINVRTFLPRKMRVRDTAESGVIVTNLGEEPQEVTISCSSDLLIVDGTASRKVTVPPQDTIPVSFTLAAEREGTGQIVFTLASAPLSERLRESFTVERPSVFESVATIGKVLGAQGPQKGVVSTLLNKVFKKAPDAPAAPDFSEEGIILPSGVPDDTGHVRVSVDSTRVTTLEQAFSYVFSYPYGCLEQITSRLLPLVSFGPYISSYGIKSEIVDVKKTVEDNLKYLAACQLPVGGFPVWPDERRADFYVSLRTAHIFFLARENGYRLPKFNEEALFSYLAANADAFKTRPYLQAYRVYVAALYKRADKTQVDGLVRASADLGLSAYGMAGLAYLALGDKGKAGAMLQNMKSFVRPNTRSLDITQPVRDKDWWDWDSDIGALSLYLMLSHKLDPRSDMVQRAITTLYERQTAGYWHNTADTNWALQALAQVIRAEEKEKPDFQARILLDGKSLLEKKLTGSAPNRQVLTLDLSSKELKGIQRDVVKPLRFEKQGPGNLYYSAELRYTIPAEIAMARDEGMGVYTDIQTVEGASVADKDLVVGQVYRMKAYITTSKKRTQVAVRLPIPSGCEALDANLATSGYWGKNQRLPAVEDEDGEWVSPEPPVHLEMLDNEVRFFIPQVYGGRTEVDFLFRAVIPGVFPTPPAAAEQMYEPAVFGRDVGRLFVIRRAQ
ncbi:MAG: alpha-2-macroglobulin family protein [Spirochaetia bacterium]